VSERTEELALAARLPIMVGGQPINLRTLTLEESEKWQAKVATLVVGFELPEPKPRLDDKGKPVLDENGKEVWDGPSGAAMFAAFAKQPSHVMLELVLAYDVGKQLGTAAALRKRLTQAELYAAVKQMVTAEFPFVMDAHSVVEAFGPQLRAMAAALMSNFAERFQQVSSTNGRSPTGASTPALSVVGSASNPSSSSGVTANGGSSAKPKRQ
jgi:hypothetical protein